MNSSKVKCEVLKKVRKSIADKLGVDLHQKECTFDGECTGTCPKCKQEEDILNREILKRAGGLAVGATAALALTGCGPTTQSDLGEIQGGMTYKEYSELDGFAPSNLGTSEEEEKQYTSEGNDSAVLGFDETIEDENIENMEPLEGDIAFEESESIEDIFNEEIPVVSEGVLPYDPEYDR